MKRDVYLITILFLLALVPAFAEYADDGYSVGYAVVHSANDIGSYFYPDSDDLYSMQIRSLNKLELSSKWFGIAADYHYIEQSVISDDDTQPHLLNAYAFGAGMPDADFIRIFGKYHVFNLNLEGLKQDNSGYSVEIAKRYRGNSLFTELKARYFIRSNEKDYDAVYSDFMRDYIYNPHQNIQLEAYLSTPFDLKLGLATDSGIAPAEGSPYLLVKHSAAGIFGSFSQLRPYKDGKDYLISKTQVPLNASRWIGMDLKHEYQYLQASVNEHCFGLCLRPTLFIAGPLSFTFLLEPELRMNERDDFAPNYTFDGGAVMSLVLKNYSNLWLQAKALNSWFPEDDLFDIETDSYRFSGGLNIRF